MTITEAAEMLAVLKAAWPNHPLDVATGAKVYHRALQDIPGHLVEKALDEWLRTGKFFPAPSEIRALALRAGLDTPSAEEAWAEVEYQFHHGPYAKEFPKWSTQILEQTVRTLGWEQMRATDDSDMGTLRAQFRNTYDSYAKRTFGSDARPALAEAAERRQAIEEANRPKVLSLPTNYEPRALPAGEETYSTIEARKRWQRANPGNAPTLARR